MMTTPPSLACVLVTDTYATLRPMVARLLSQPGPHRLELIVAAVLLLCLMKSIGEAWGYLFGCPEWAHSAEADIEIQRLRYARGFTQ